MAWLSPRGLRNPTPSVRAAQTARVLIRRRLNAALDAAFQDSLSPPPPTDATIRRRPSTRSSSDMAPPAFMQSYMDAALEAAFLGSPSPNAPEDEAFQETQSPRIAAADDLSSPPTNFNPYLNAVEAGRTRRCNAYVHAPTKCSRDVVSPEIDQNDFDAEVAMPESPSHMPPGPSQMTPGKNTLPMDASHCNPYLQAVLAGCPEKNTSSPTWFSPEPHQKYVDPTLEEKPLHTRANPKVPTKPWIWEYATHPLDREPPETSPAGLECRSRAAAAHGHQKKRQQEAPWETKKRLRLKNDLAAVTSVLKSSPLRILPRRCSINA